MSKLAKKVKGQIIIGVSLALFAMFGILGLVFDLGWSYFVEKQTQAAADAAAMASALDVLDRFGATSPYNCGQFVFCSATPVACASAPVIGSTPGDSLDAGCVYARRNGYWRGNPDRRQNVRMAAGAAGAGTVTVAHVPGVNVRYWATAMVAEETPQLFSAILGNAWGISSSSATAAIVDSIIPGSLFLLNREGDCLGVAQNNGCGANLYVNANSQGCNGGNCGPPTDFSLRVEGGVRASSSLSGNGQHDHAAIASGNALVESDDFRIRDNGTYNEIGNAIFDVIPQNYSDPDFFKDPTRPLPNPPLPSWGSSTMTNYIPVVNGNLTSTYAVGGSGTQADPWIMPPGFYYSYQVASQNTPETANGNPITLPQGHFKFGNLNNSQFGDYVFLGGLELNGTELQYGPGRYVYAGAKPQGGNPGQVLDITQSKGVTDNLTPGQVADIGNAGQIHILAGPNYTDGNGRSLYDMVTGVGAPPNAHNIPAVIGASNNGIIEHGSTDFRFGNNDTSLNIHGLNPLDSQQGNNDGLPAELEPYRRYVVWQDRDNSVVDYTANGEYNCDAPYVSGCSNPTGPADPAATELDIQASPDTDIYGIVYQPRGSFATMTGGGGYSGPLQIITGGLRITGDSVVDLGILPHPLTTRIVALVQ